jgi:dihydrofolate reductase
VLREASAGAQITPGDSILKQQDGKDILLSRVPAALAPIATVGLVDEYLLAVSPAVLAEGPRAFEGTSKDHQLRLVASKVFDAGAVVLRYQVIST